MVRSSHHHHLNCNLHRTTVNWVFPSPNFAYLTLAFNFGIHATSSPQALFSSIFTRYFVPLTTPFCPRPSLRPSSHSPLSRNHQAGLGRLSARAPLWAAETKRAQINTTQGMRTASLLPTRRLPGKGQTVTSTALPMEKQRRARRLCQVSHPRT